MDNPLQISNDQPFRDLWIDFLTLRHEFASEIDKIASDLSGVGGKHLRLLSRWFKGPADFEDALQRPDVLAICLPLIKKMSKQPIGTNDLAQAARLGFCSLVPNVSFSRRLIRLLIYPMLILIATAGLAVGFSCFLAPEFEDMFEEFGIALPDLTVAVLAVSRLIRHLAPLILSIPIGFVLLVLFLSWPGSGKGQTNLGWIDQRFMSTRNALASWTWHISLLLELGVSQIEAIRAAGDATGNQWLKAISVTAVTNTQPDQRLDEVDLRFYQNFHLLDCAMRLPMSAGKIMLLRKVAAYYWDRNYSFGGWWLSWLVVVIMWIVGFAVFLSILALFMPLIAIVSGLT